MTTTVSKTSDINADVLKEGATLEDVLKAVRAALIPSAPTGDTPLPKSVALTPEVLQTLKTLGSTLADLTVPTTRRQLTEDELEPATIALEDLTRVKSALEGVDKRLKQIWQTNFDAVAMRDRKVTDATNFNKDGFFVLEDTGSAAVEGLGKKVVRIPVYPTAVLTAEALAELEADGFINHTEYLAATKPVRVLDEDGVMTLVRERPGLLPTLAAAAVSEKDPYTQIRLAPNND